MITKEFKSFYKIAGEVKVAGVIIPQDWTHSDAGVVTTASIAMLRACSIFEDYGIQIDHLLQAYRRLSERLRLYQRTRLCDWEV